MNKPFLNREIGTVKASPLKRFGRNQRRAALVAPRAGRPKGIQLFKTWEEVEECRRKTPTKK